MGRACRRLVWIFRFALGTATGTDPTAKSAGEKRRLPSGPENALNCPEQGDERDQRGGRNHNHAPIPRPVAKPAHGETRADNHGKLAALHAEVEADQANEEVLAGQANIGKGAGEAESVNQPEAKNDCIPPRFK